jgi:small subunit ribosomal protein S1
VTHTLTEEQSGGTTPEPEAIASAEPQPEQTVAAVAVADEPATSQEVLAAAAAEDSAEAPTVEPATPEAVADAPGQDAEAEAVDSPGDAPAAGTEVAAQAPSAVADESASAVADESASAVAGEPAADHEDGLGAHETADAPSAGEEEDEPAPARELGPEPTTMAELLAEQDSDIKSFKHGDVVEGQVVRIDKDEILVDIGAKSEGVVSNRELFGRHGESQPALNIGDTVLVYVLQPESPEGHVVLSLRRAGLERKWRAMQEQFEAGVIIEAPVIDHNKGGLIVDCGIRGFVPISQIVDFPRRPQNDQPRDAAQEIAEKLQPFVGRKLRLKILEVNRKANRLILSEKVALYEERREKRDELFSSLQVGQKVTGTVRSIAPFGVFIDLGGIDGLVHKSELSWNKVNNPEAGYRVGEEVEAEVIDINHERGRISLSIRRLQPDPWHSTVADFKVGDIIDGTVTKLVNFGAFVRVRDGLEGLIHISELSHQRVAHPGDVVHEGQTLKLKIISLDSERHRLGLSLKQAEEPPARPAPEPGLPAPSVGPRPERRPRPERSYSMSDAVQEPEGGIDNTLASAFAQVRQQLAAAEVDDIVQTVAEDEAAEETAATAEIESIVDDVAADEAAEEAAAATLVETVAEVVAEDEAAEEAAATAEIDAVVEAVAADETASETEAAAEIESIVEAVAADEAAMEADAAGEIAGLEDAAAANEANEPIATEAIVEVVESVAAAEEAEESAAAAEIGEIVDEVNADEFAEETAAAAEIGEIVDEVNADEFAEETAAAAVVEQVVETVAADEATEEAAADAEIEQIVESVAADEAAEETLAAEAITEIADETMEANTKG